MGREWDAAFASSRNALRYATLPKLVVAGSTPVASSRFYLQIISTDRVLVGVQNRGLVLSFLGPWDQVGPSWLILGTKRHRRGNGQVIRAQVRVPLRNRKVALTDERFDLIE